MVHRTNNQANQTFRTGYRGAQEGKSQRYFAFPSTYIVIYFMDKPYAMGTLSDS